MRLILYWARCIVLLLAASVLLVLPVAAAPFSVGDRLAIDEPAMSVPLIQWNLAGQEALSCIPNGGNYRGDSYCCNGFPAVDGKCRATNKLPKDIPYCRPPPVGKCCSSGSNRGNAANTAAETCSACSCALH